MSGKELDAFAFNPFPREISFLTGRFSDLRQTFRELGIANNTDLDKLENVELILPGLAKVLGLPTLSLDQLSLNKKEIPSDIVFARNEDIDFDISLILDDQGNPQQKINTLAGKNIQLVIKPEYPVSSIKGYFIFTKKLAQTDSINISRTMTASLVLNNTILESSKDKPVTIEEKLVLSEFEYFDEDNDGIYVANVQTPVVAGEYEIISVMEYLDESLERRAVKLITVVDPEGYIYEKVNGQELRINQAKVSLYWLDNNEYVLWPGDKYQQKNPQITNNTGTYSFLVPKGTYYLQVEANGYKTFQGDPFEVSGGTGIHENISLERNWRVSDLLDWKFMIIALMIILLIYNFYRDRIRDKKLNN